MNSPFQAINELKELTRKKTQKDRIRELLQEGWANAVDLHQIAWRYSAVIADLKKDGYVIDRQKGKNKLYEWRIL